ncbi:transglutaminaseTgpA domain-containing protein [Neptunomonas antarctica]|uniref:Transglutaminase-like enzyme, putative cysteine protease n=1 Tax=Neptunomonas antarctica TaxID=619304 RepID=A0A1N7NNP3_9GAMM|nr:transglutaminaseTgpA domain-containing protein [Neptunomonas antarctica]SIT00023.1 Transglutaminase-like enzyme, putative cysteine protease [Neptunomonas antarctica]
MSVLKGVSQKSASLDTPVKTALIVMLLVICVPQLVIIPLWLAIIAGCILAWILLSLIRPERCPNMPRWGRGVLVAGVILGVLMSAVAAQGLGGLSTLLVAAAVLKTLELKTRRDGWVLVLVACFIAAVGFLFNQSMLAALYGLISLVVIFTALIMMHQGDQNGSLGFRIVIKSAGSKSAVILLQSMPLMLILFLIFPRISPLWSVQLQHSAAKTGLSDSMSPGDISQLARSDDVAFRVSFSTDRPPPPAARYWRAMTYSVFDGRRWSMGKDTLIRTAGNTLQQGDIEYQVIAEPSAHVWLFALDYSVGAPSQGVLSVSDGSYRAGSPLLERINYHAYAEVTRRYNGEPLNERSRYLFVPETGNPKSRALVNQWRKKGMTSEEIIDALFMRFNQHFYYTLSPQRLTDDRIDQFLFSTQEGFCEHFANATAYTLRLAGIPTRIVAGYLGGEWNPYEKYLLVRQYEAHAWVEAWVEGKGWIRLDPTAAVAPERVTQPFDLLFADAPEFMADSPLSAINLQHNLTWLSAGRLRYEALNYSWHRWVLGYHQEQNSLLEEWFGRLNFIKMLLLLFIPVGCVLALVIWWLLRARPHSVSPLDKAAVTMSDTLGRLAPALQRVHGETISQYSRRLKEVLPGLREELEEWHTLYQRVRYAQILSDEAVYYKSSRQLVYKIKRLEKHDIDTDMDVRRSVR